MSEADRAPLDPNGSESELDPYRRWDAAYVLGALSPAERREFEDHLATCGGCRGEVAGIAGLPGLLAQMSPDDAAVMAGGNELPAETGGAGGRTAAQQGRLARPAGATQSEAETGPVSETQWARLDRQRRRLAWAVVALAAALVLVTGVLGVAAFRGSFALQRPTATGPFRLAFAPVVPTGITAVVDIVPEAVGTQVKVECQYAAEGRPPNPVGRDYTIVVVDQGGHASEVKTWTARANHRMTPTGVSPLPVSEIAAVEIRPAHSDRTLLQAHLP